MFFCLRYVALDHEMEEISGIWKSAKDHLNSQQIQVHIMHIFSMAGM